MINGESTSDLFRSKYRVQSTRLRGWDFSGGGYCFDTVCVKERQCVFVRALDGKIILSEIGAVADKCRADIPNHFAFVKWGNDDQFVHLDR